VGSLSAIGYLVFGVALLIARDACNGLRMGAAGTFSFADHFFTTSELNEATFFLAFRNPLQ